VGYSAGLLNYFFRGALEISAPDRAVYGIADGSQNPQQITAIRAGVMNTTPNEALGSGILQAIARYKLVPNYAPDLSNYPPDGASMQNAPYSYSVSAPLTLSDAVIASLNTMPTELAFDFSSSPIPAGITDLTLQVVFKGTLGNEIDTAIAVGMKDLSEPTHIVIWNLTDMFSLGFPANGTYDFHLHTSQEIQDNAYWSSLVDLNGNGVLNEAGEPYINEHDVTAWVGFSGTDPKTQLPAAAAAVVPAGRYIRLITLSDDKEASYLQLQWQSVANPEGGWFNVYFTGVVNQAGQDGTWQPNTPSAAFRYGLAADGQTPVPIRQHYVTSLVSCHPTAVDASGNEYCPYAEKEALPAKDIAPMPVQIN
jgi:hypothetical protein